MAHDSVSRHVLENCNFIIVAEVSLATLMVENNYVIGQIQFVVNDYVWAALTKGFDNFGRLWASTATRSSRERTVRPSSSAAHLP